MRIKKTIKTIGKCFIDLKQEGEGIIGQSVLIVDNGYSWVGYLNLAIERIKNYFPRAEISVLASPERKSNLQKGFPGLNYILPSPRLRPKRYQVALQILRMRKKRYDFIILLSLDIIPLIISLFFFKSRVVLYNQWEQWWSLRFRNLSEIFKVSYTKKKTRFSLRNFLKRIGLFFVLLQRQDEKLFRPSILVVDNDCASFKHIDAGIGRIKEYLSNAEISVLTTGQREGLKGHFHGLMINQAGDCVIKRLRIARHMLALRKNSYDYIVLLSLDVTPIIVSMLFMKGKVILFNRWQQWWVFKSKSMRRYLMVIPQFILNIIIFVYLSISVFWIFLKRSFNVFRFNLLNR